MYYIEKISFEVNSFVLYLKNEEWGFLKTLFFFIYFLFIYFFFFGILMFNIEKLSFKVNSFVLYWKMNEDF